LVELLSPFALALIVTAIHPSCLDVEPITKETIIGINGIERVEATGQRTLKAQAKQENPLGKGNAVVGRR